MTRTARALVPATLAAAGALAACTSNPVSGRPQLMVYDDAAERRMGADGDADLVKHHGLVESAALSSYVAEIGARVAAASDRPKIQWTFRVLDDTTVNAFALPGGFVYLTRGSIAYIQDEAGLASVLGHEIGHVAALHGASQASREAVFGLPRRLVGAIVPILGDALGLLRLPLAPLTLKYSREQENQADELGVKYATALGYDARSLAGFMGALDELTAEEGQLPTWLSTHPDPGDRVVTIQKEAAEAQAEAKRTEPWVTAPERLLPHLDGLVFGEDPRLGSFVGGLVRLPLAGVSFQAPGDWSFEATRARVTLISPDAEKVLVLRRVAGTSPREAARAFVKERELTVDAEAEVQLGIGPAYRVIVATPDEELRSLSTFFSLRDEVWAFHAVAPGDDFGPLRDALEAPSNTLARLHESSVSEARPVRIRIVQAKAAGTFAEAVKDWPLPGGIKVDLKALAVLNGLEPSSKVADGQRLKVLVRDP